jgi:tripartite-type tricarboxylate transporter receptor subunit TctC
MEDEMIKDWAGGPRVNQKGSRPAVRKPHRAFRPQALALASLAAFTCAQVLPAAADPVEDFYKGKTISMLVSSAPGGVNDLVGRLLAQYLPKYIPGHPNMIVQNQTTAGGLVLGNRMYSVAEKDGTVIAIVERSTPQLAVQGEPNAKFDPLKFTWLGSVSSYANDAYLLEVNSSFPAKTVQDLMKKDSPVARVGTTGAGASNLVFSVLAKDALGINLQVVRGYRGASRVFLAQQSGELDGQIVGFSSLQAGQAALWKEGFFRPLLAFGRTTRDPALPDVPTARELVKDPATLSLLKFAEAPFFAALPVLAPPGVPADRAAALEKAFMQTVQDPDFKKTAIEKMHLDLSPIDGAGVRKVIQEMKDTPPDVIERFNKIVNLKK